MALARDLNRHRADIRAMQRYRMRRRASRLCVLRERIGALRELRWPDLLP